MARFLLRPGINLAETNSCHRVLQGNPEESDLAEAQKALRARARDNARTPMQWSADAHGGFTSPSVQPWMRVNDDYKEVNASLQVPADDPDQLSTWQFWRRGLIDRKEHADAFVYGEFEMLQDEDPNVISYIRKGKDSGKWVTVLNMSTGEGVWKVPRHLTIEIWVAGTYAKSKPEKSLEGKLSLRPWEGMLGKCS
jgi:oligo-1,6-glucosidase